MKVRMNGLSNGGKKVLYVSPTCVAFPTFSPHKRSHFFPQNTRTHINTHEVKAKSSGGRIVSSDAFFRGGIQREGRQSARVGELFGGVVCYCIISINPASSLWFCAMPEWMSKRERQRGYRRIAQGWERMDEEECGSFHALNILLIFLSSFHQRSFDYAPSHSTQPPPEHMVTSKGHHSPSPSPNPTSDDDAGKWSGGEGDKTSNIKEV